MSELQLCPSRVPGPWELPAEDQWVADRWLVDPDAVKLRHQVEDAGRKNVVHRGPDNDLWRDPSAPPRTCSYCGGCLPEDVLRLLQAGWELESTDKSYKRYLQPPGYHAHMNAYFDTLKDAFVRPGEMAVMPEFWHPTPPVKVYVAHFSNEQIDRANQIIKAQRDAALCA